MPTWQATASIRHGAPIQRQLYDKICPASHNADFRFIIVDQFQFGLPPGWNAIILAVKVGIAPVGVRP
jgi:hypothetical protein